MEFIADGHVAHQFQVLSNYLRPTYVYHCPTDTTRFPAADYQAFTDTNISYFVNIDAEAAPAVLTGDRNLRFNGRTVQPGSFVFTNATTMDWTHELHYQTFGKSRGVIGFVDGHAELVPGTNLTTAFARQGTNDQRLLVP
jgi:prepilin-type processing-associated H-X9-DG protein